MAKGSMSYTQKLYATSFFFCSTWKTENFINAALFIYYNHRIHTLETHKSKCNKIMNQTETNYKVNTTMNINRQNTISAHIIIL